MRPRPEFRTPRDPGRAAGREWRTLPGAPILPPMTSTGSPAPAADDSIDTPERSHDFEDREELLRGIAPPAKRGPAAAPPSTGKAK